MTFLINSKALQKLAERQSLKALAALDGLFSGHEHPRTSSSLGRGAGYLVPFLHLVAIGLAG